MWFHQKKKQVRTLLSQARDQGQMVETCCAKQFNKSLNQKVVIVEREVRENLEPRMTIFSW